MSDFKFSCPACGQHIVCDTSNAGMSIACPACQAVLMVPQPPPAAPPALSIAAPPAQPATPEPGHTAGMMSHSNTAVPPGPAAPGQRKYSGLAIASFICSLFLCLGSIPAIVCGHLARRGLRRDPSLKGGGFALAGLIISYCSLLFTLATLALGLTTFISAFKKGFADAQQQSKSFTEHAPDNSASPSAAPEKAPAKIAPDDSLWNLNLTTAQFPDQPAAGKIHGLPFSVESAKFQNGNLMLRQGENTAAELQITINTFLTNGEPLAGRSFDISPANSDLTVGTPPHVHMSWKEDGQPKPKPKLFKTGYALKLEFSRASNNGKVPAKIYLCLPDPEKSYVAGNFELEVRKASAKPKKTKKAATNSTALPP